MKNELEQTGISSQLYNNERGKTKTNSIDVPTISLPKGGGAIKGIDEKFSVNAVNGTSSFSIPLPFSPARGVSPSLTINYNSGAGNGIFGLGWNLGLSSIRRKTEQGLPLYNDADDSDVFHFSEAEDLVPEFKKNDDGNFALDPNGEYIVNERDSSDNLNTIRYYKPRIEGLFARIERWTEKLTGIIKWKITSRNNVTTLFGWNINSVISDPKSNLRIFEWLPEFVFDDKGNCSQYIYKHENSDGFDNSLLHNVNRFKDGKITYTNLYPEKVVYGNKTPYKQFGDAFPSETDYLYSTVFDYGEYNQNSPFDKNNDWHFRHDAFSVYKPGFEIRTTRLCKRVMLFHHFKGLNEYDGLVHSINFKYEISIASNFTFLKSITSTGYIKNADGSYNSKSLPAMEFEYQKHEWNSELKVISADAIIHAPVGFDDQQYHFTDLFGEGLSGILTEQANGWYYKSNLGEGRFEQSKMVSPKPSFSGLGGGMQLTDLDADGGKQLINFGTEIKGFFELNNDNEWLGFQSFKSIPNINFGDNNTRMLDLNGDGKPEVVISEEQVFTWYASEGKNGYSAAQKSPKSFDEEAGPHIVFADSMQSIFLADMSGDGLTDIVRIKNGDVCYWPNMGYGIFGAKIAMENSPSFDRPEFYNPAYLRLADIDGSGTTDIIYLGKNKFTCWKNLNGNSFDKTPFEITGFPEIHEFSKIAVTDFLGNGVSCIVWSGQLPKDANFPVRYVDLMNSKKPHILVSYKNNLGKEISLEYTPSTRFFIEDKLAGKPWITKLHFPVHCVSKTITEDKISGYKYISEYKYHHGYYDHPEKEFRGFGMVEQFDAETFEHWKKENATNITEETLHQEPVVTKTWNHTGAFLQKDKILNQFSRDYWYEELQRKGFSVLHNETVLSDAKITVAHGLNLSVVDGLSAQEWREAMRACKGMGLRTELFAKDAIKYGNTENAVKKELTPYSVANHNCIVEILQPKGKNKHAVFVVKESEAITYNYERNPEDPRIAHSLNIKLDEYGNVLESASVVYPRFTSDISIPAETRQEQSKTAIIYTQNNFTNDVITDNTHRLRMPSEVKRFELKGVAKSGTFYLPSDFENILSDIKSDTALFHETDLSLAGGKAQKRLIEQIRSTYYNNLLTGALPTHRIESLGLPCENYQLAFTPELIADIYGIKVDNAQLTEGGYANIDGNWWIPSGTTKFKLESENESHAQNRFYAPISYASPFGAETKVKYYGNYFLFIDETEDALGNKSGVEVFNFRTLSPQKMRDINGNFSEVVTDELGFVKGLALLGKGDDADDLTGINKITDTEEQTSVSNFFQAPNSVQLTNIGKSLLNHATTRYIYDFEAYLLFGKPAVVATVSREKHFQMDNNSPVQIGFEYSNGLGEVVMKKVQAEPGLAKLVSVNPDNTITISEIDTSDSNPKQLRWIGNGRTIKNNKGNAVKQYEPYFSVNPGFENYKELVETGVTPVMYYDAAGRLEKTEMPDGTFSKVEFDSWIQAVYDANDTVTESDWYLKRTDNTRPDFILDIKEQQAATKTAKHSGTPTVLHFDNMGRAILSIEHNKNTLTNADEFYRTKIKLDTEGNLRSVTDAREIAENGNKGNVVMQYKYDMLGNQVYQNSMDAGQRWLLKTIAGNPLRTWDERNHEFRFFYDILQRPTHSLVLGGPDTPLNHIFDRVFYGESLLEPNRSNEVILQTKNLLGQVIRHYDTGGMVDIQDYDFKGNPVAINQKLFGKYKEVSNWTDANLLNDLEPGTGFKFSTETDALGRIIRQVSPDGSIVTPTYNEAGLLNGETVILPGEVLGTTYIKNIIYNEKGQREKIIYGNNVSSKFYYDKETFKLKRLESKRQNGDPLQDWYYTYDPVGNITHIEDKNIPVVFFDNQKIAGISTYTYDAIYRLAEATGRENNTAIAFGNCDNWNDKAFFSQLKNGDPMAVRNYSQHYKFDEVGNIKEMKHLAAGGNWTRNYEYETNNNRLKSTGIGDNGNSANYTNYKHHLKHGFLEELPHLENISWNFKEEVVSTTRQHCTDDNIPVITYYQYDGNGQRIRKITENQSEAGAVPTIKEERIYIAGYEVYKKHSGPNTGLERISLSLMDEGHRFAMIEIRNDVDDGTEKQLVRYQLHNHLGSAALELDGSPASRVISYEEFHPFGTTAYLAKNSDIKSAAKRYRYTGMERDEETGLEYHNARYYLPWLGRWLNTDPVGIKDSVNLYAYCKNNPVSYSDQSGLSTDYEETPEQILNIEKMFSVTDDSSGSGSGGGILDGLLNTISEIGAAIGSAIVAVGEWIAETAVKAWNWITETATAAWNWIKQAANDAWNWIKGAAETAWDWTKNAAVAAWNWIKDAASSAWEWIKNAAAEVWNWFLAPLIRTATNALAGFAIGFLTGDIAGGVIGAVTGAATGAIHGWAMADAHSYDWSSGSGWLSFLADNTWSLPNSLVGSLFATANIIGGNPIDRTNSRNSNALMFDNEWFSGYATTLGNVIVGTKGLSHDVVQHELAHVLQARIFGPVFYPSMIAHYAINTFLPFWLFYHNARYPNTPIRNFGEYFSRGVYPHTWAEEWGYSVGGHPN